MKGGLSPASPPGIYLNFRKRSVAATSRSLENAMEEESLNASSNESTKLEEVCTPAATTDDPEKDPNKATLSERRRALFEPLQPSTNGHRTPAELLPQPDFESSSYPKGWLVGKKRKLVNVDVVESMRRIAIQEMNRKDREIGGLNQQLEEDARCMEHLQLQLLQERSKRADVERQNALLQEQVSMLMGMLEETENLEEDESSINP